MPPDPTTTDHAAIQAHIDETLKVSDAATVGPWCCDDYVVNPGDSPGQQHVYLAGEDSPPLLSTEIGTMADVLFCAHAREMLPRYARALEKARTFIKAHTAQCWHPVSDRELMAILNSESEGSDG